MKFSSNCEISDSEKFIPFFPTEPFRQMISWIFLPLFFGKASGNSFGKESYGFQNLGRLNVSIGVGPNLDKLV